MEDVGATQPKLAKACDDCKSRKVRCTSKCPDTDADSHAAGYLTLFWRNRQSQCSVMHGLYRETHIDRRMEYGVLIVHTQETQCSMSLQSYQEARYEYADPGLDASVPTSTVAQHPRYTELFTQYGRTWHPA